MRIFTTLDEARAHLAGEKKWDRAFEAIDASARLPHGIAYSVGDSLTWRGVGPECAEESLTASRRYLRVVYCATGSIEVRISDDWAPTCPYSDLSDRQGADGPDRPILLGAGALLLVDIHEATRLVPAPDFSGALLRVTVEGRSFHNK
ncbi:hypothetical protein M3T53_05355 [Actinomyces sp. B33]|uniref:hypothetical protein n=1 Tax=Actinomyces sp. B33 TaxID=2942131 RepID=UPI0023425EC1|nr:hypothetical protein [Actinomyces sp. B33]MDC4233139.1 hypothetical protein [Actinomyces sp. B33]